MINHRQEILDQVARVYPNNSRQDMLDKIVEFAKTTTDPIKLRQLWLKVCKPYSKQLDINGGETILEPAPVKAKEMTMEEIKLAFDSPR